ncbi:MAG: hypothetical protein Q8L39_05275 [Burkholderiales bacterium]|nr:hypothetical protein [Burkholderiales bacterium]
MAIKRKSKAKLLPLVRDTARRTIIERFEVCQSLRPYKNLIGALMARKKTARQAKVTDLRERRT